ncbi:MAG: hypothetical protein GWN01_00700 [Nitrosopumilaceae archaeon]|nr:hypothetical protein [Nitrosopumilaceae archaeon]NIT99499.1 hypothetical protein [Nitrosopumilaceae archaeon]NIU85858.1 hypothetical protein [Nitrosopumilaceae archaeon]NIV64715.1 hypothetical protein [Nitrosopumilaceae archaeon]NIX60102.1 hypothetical protein [Nitrosopumilaceae archaeon]
MITNHTPTFPLFDLWSWFFVVIGQLPFILSILWKNRLKIIENKKRIETFGILSFFGMIGVGFSVGFGFVSIGLGFNTVLGNLVGFGSVPEFLHMPITIGVIGFCVYMTYAGIIITKKVSKDIRKAMNDPNFIVKGFQN